MKQTKSLFHPKKVTKMSNTSHRTQEEALLLFLLRTDSASTMELELMGFTNPSATIHKLRKKNVPIRGYFQPPKIINGIIVYTHFRYILNINDLLEVTHAA